MNFQGALIYFLLCAGVEDISVISSFTAVEPRSLNAFFLGGRWKRDPGNDFVKYRQGRKSSIVHSRNFGKTEH